MSPIIIALLINDDCFLFRSLDNMLGKDFDIKSNTGAYVRR